MPIDTARSFIATVLNCSWIRYDVTDPTCPPEILVDAAQDPQYHEALLMREDCPSDILEKLSVCGNEQARSSLAALPDCPDHILRCLATDPVDIVRVMVAQRSGLSVEILGLLARDDHWKVRQSVAQNPLCPDEILAQLIQHPDTPDDPNHAVAQAVLRHTDCSKDTLISLVTHDSSTIRRLVASHPRCPMPTLIQLVADPVTTVHWAALENPTYSTRPKQSMANPTTDQQ